MTVLAHGIGGATDLPIPLSYALVGAAWALTFSFAVLVLAWAERADPLEVYSSLLGRLSPLGRRDSGELVLRSPLNNLAGTPVRVAAVAVAATLLGSTAFDSFSTFPSWRGLLADAGGGGYEFLPTVLKTVGLLGFIVVVGGLFCTAARATGGLPEAERKLLPARLAYSLSPIVAGYLVAHYLTFLVEKGQATVLLFADPFGRGWNLAGLADRDVAYLLSTHLRCWGRSRCWPW